MVDFLGRSTAPPGGDPMPAVERARARLDARLTAIRASAETWGIRSDTPEGSMLSALLGAISEMGEVTVQASDTMTALVTDFGRDLDRRRDAAQRSVDQLACAARDGGTLVEQLRVSVDRTQLVRDDLPKRVASVLVPDLSRALTEPIRARLSLRNREDLLRLWLRSGAAAIGLAFVAMVFGYVMGVREPGFTDMQVDWCQKNPIVSGDKGYCDLDRLRPAWRSAPGMPTRD